jgi:hypothetical protein
MHFCFCGRSERAQPTLRASPLPLCRIDWRKLYGANAPKRCTAILISTGELVVLSSGAVAIESTKANLRNPALGRTRL